VERSDRKGRQNLGGVGGERKGSISYDLRTCWNELVFITCKLLSWFFLLVFWKIDIDFTWVFKCALITGEIFRNFSTEWSASWWTGKVIPVYRAEISSELWNEGKSWKTEGDVLKASLGYRYTCVWVDEEMLRFHREDVSALGSVIYHTKPRLLLHHRSTLVSM
jgi:hypothetical protein